MTIIKEQLKNSKISIHYSTNNYYLKTREQLLPNSYNLYLSNLLENVSSEDVELYLRIIMSSLKEYNRLSLKNKVYKNFNESLLDYESKLLSKIKKEFKKDNNFETNLNLELRDRHYLLEHNNKNGLIPTYLTHQISKKDFYIQDLLYELDNVVKTEDEKGLSIGYYILCNPEKINTEDPDKVDHLFNNIDMLLSEIIIGENNSSIVNIIDLIEESIEITYGLEDYEIVLVYNKDNINYSISKLVGDVKEFQTLHNELHMYLYEYFTKHSVI